jgi:ectoine hydroxylase-related dioxygenase (phytanoyl-CoA dioxygenase family)
LQDAFRFDQDVRRIATNERVIELLTKLFGRPAWPFQTLNFPVGSEQHYHTDSIHFSSIPERFMCGVWTALEDIDSECGPLVYYPGSHRWPIYTNESLGIKSMAGVKSDEPYKVVWRALVEQSGIKPRVFEARKGQSLIWLSNLLHGGMAHTNKSKTRWSQVTHYYFEECAYYTPMHSDPFIGKVEFRELHDIRSGKEMPNRYAGMTLPKHMTRRFHPARVALKRLRNFLHI